MPDHSGMTDEMEAYYNRAVANISIGELAARRGDKDEEINALRCYLADMTKVFSLADEDSEFREESKELLVFVQDKLKELEEANSG